MLYSAGAFILGLMGSFHCAGMCGPISMALPVGGLTRDKKILAVLAYHLGRITSYGLIGWAIGWLGLGIRLAGVQQYLSVILGVLLLCFAIMPQRFKNEVERKLGNNPIWKLARQNMAVFFSRRDLSSFFMIGFVNGWLPCGLVYVAVAGALVSFNMLYSILFMMLFGLGTMPLMLALYFTGTYISAGLRARLFKMLPYLVSVFSIVLILRGLNLGIPYLSPDLKEILLSGETMCR
ncbi:MAG: sulfite exporter TauE/SafE family protein [Chitinophagales bacterium]|nr:sulfite exporter TauE/SafE family protein [Chitinophagales bacterium]MDW8274469.1 sulfite exporter TauE/SafE family protein [Chitinophagales bacterium]